MLFNLLLHLVLSIYPKIETYEIPFNQNFQISLMEGSLVFINTDSFTTDDFIFKFKSNNTLNNSYVTDNFDLIDLNNANSSFLSPKPDVHLIFEKELCGDFITIIPNLRKIKEKAKKQNNLFLKKKKAINNSFILHFWRIPDGLCDVNSYVIRSNNMMSIVPRSRSFSRFCIFSSINFTTKFKYHFNFHTTGSLLSRNTLKVREVPSKINETIQVKEINNFTANIIQTEFSNNTNLSTSNTILSNAIDDKLNFIIELFVSGNIGSTLLKSNVDVELTRPFLILGSYDDLNIGKLLLKFQSDDSECSARPIVKYKSGRVNDQKVFSNKKRELISKEETIQIDSNPSSIEKEDLNSKIDEKNSKLHNSFIYIKSKLLYLKCKMKGKNFCDPNPNSISFSYSTLFSPLLSLSTVSIEMDGWKRIDVKCIEKGNDADAGFISLVVILVGMVIFVLFNARKFVIFSSNEIDERQETEHDHEDNEIHLDIKDTESEVDN